MPPMTPSTSVRKCTPSSTPCAALASPVEVCGTVGSANGFQIVHGQICTTGGVTFTATPPDGVSRLPLSSTPRVLMVASPCAEGVHTYDQLSRPTAGCHVVPPSVETSTPPTAPLTSGSTSDAV